MAEYTPTVQTDEPAFTGDIEDLVTTTRTQFGRANTDILALVALITAAETDHETDLADHIADATAHNVDGIQSDLDDVEAEILTARGSKDTLGERLANAVENDGKIRLTSIASKWINNSDSPTYVSATSFKVAEDRTGVYIAGTILRFTVAAGYVYGIVSSSSYAASYTTVTLEASYNVLTDPISTVEIALLAFDNSVQTSVTQNSSDIADLQAQVSAYMAMDIVEKTGAYTIESNVGLVLGDATSAAFQIDMEPSPSDKRTVVVMKIDATANAITNDGNGKNINGAGSQALTSQWDFHVYRYSSAKGQWYIIGRN